jgi:transcriptional regulator GlxA family with amidase domain
VLRPTGGGVLASSGLEFTTTPIAEVTEPVDTLVVAGGRAMDEACADEHLLRHVRRLASSARRVSSVCSGAFILAAAGLLDGRRATTHWAECHLLAVGHPTVSLVADDHGRRAAATVARQLVVYLRRSGGQAQFSTLLAAQAADSEPPLRELLAWLPDNLAADLSVPALAAGARLSERQFSRVFKAEVDVTPSEHVEVLRLDAACRLLETTSHSVEQIARTCGFGTPETMNRAFRRRLNTTPGDHRRHFGDVAEG